MFVDKTVLITGGTGYIGQFLTSTICLKNAHKVIVYSRDEEKQYFMQQHINCMQAEYIIGDIKDYNRLNDVLGGVDYVIHAAAMKQVPIAEKNPMEAVLTNIIGTENIIRAAIQQKVKKVLCLSSDKAISPTNCMGMTKGICERLVTSSSNWHIETDILCIRLGNVLGSTGSVIPLWKNQVNTNKKITLTSKEMTRYIMTIDDVYQLVVHALEHGRHGEIIFSNMKACSIYDLAKEICQIYNRDIQNDVLIIGTRPGEKIYEELFALEEYNHIYENKNFYHITPNSTNSKLQLIRKSNESVLLTSQELREIIIKNRLI